MERLEQNNLLIKNTKSWIDTLPSSDWKKRATVALEEFEKIGIPHKKIENWKYTNALNYFENSSDQFDGNENSKLDLEKVRDSLISNDLVIIKNGQLDQENSNLPKGVSLTVETPESETFSSLDLKDIESHSLVNLNLSSAKRVFKLKLNDYQSATPLIVLHYNDSSSNNKRINSVLLVETEGKVDACLIESFRGDDDVEYFNNSFTSINVSKNSLLEYVKVCLEGNQGKHYGFLSTNINKDAHFNSFALSLSGKIVRNEAELLLREENARGESHGLFALKSDQHCDNTGNIHHLVPRTFSEQLYKGLLDDNSHGIFSGKVIIHKDAQESESSQLNKNLLLAKKAHINTRPQLEVYADDVKCAHGATTGQIGEEEIFYLQSRGLSAKRALSLLKEAFAKDALAKINNGTAKKKLEKLLFDNYSNLLDKK